MGYITSSRPPSVATTKSSRMRRTMSLIFRWKIATEPTEPVPELPSNIPFRTESEPDRDRTDDAERERASSPALRDCLTPDALAMTPVDQRETVSAPVSVQFTGESVTSETASSDQSYHRNASPLEMVPEDGDFDGLPTYCSAAYPSEPVAYSFVRCSPFAMLVMSDTVPEQPIYHISVGVNVWMPTSFTTCIRRGDSEDGKFVAQLEMGITARSALLSIGRHSKPLNAIFHKKGVKSNVRIYHVGDGKEIKWKIGGSGWQAHLGPALLATFIPATTLVLQPAAQPLFDHIIIGLVILMRQYLTPRCAQAGETAGLFNYVEQMQNAHTNDCNEY